MQQRLARWLLAAQDRQEQDVLPLTHDMLSRMLGVRRASVSECVGALQGKGVLGKARGLIKIEQRAKLEAIACRCYRIMTAEYERMYADLGTYQSSPARTQLIRDQQVIDSSRAK